MTDFDAQLAELLRGTQEVLVGAELVKKLRRGKPLHIKAGFDPTARRDAPRAAASDPA